MRATAQDPDAAADGHRRRPHDLADLPPRRPAGGAAGVIYALYNGTIQFNQGFTAGLIAFTAAVMGGIGNLKGAVVGRPDHRRHPGDLDTPLTARCGPRRWSSRSSSWSWSSGPRASSARRRARDERAHPDAGGGNVTGACALPNWAWVIVLRGVPVRLAPAIIEALLGGRRPRPAAGLDRDAGLHHHGARAEHRRRLRRPARPRLRGLLRHRRLRAGWLRSLHFADVDIHIRASRVAEPAPGIHMNFPLSWSSPRSSRRSGARSWAPRRCACAATTWRS